METCSKKMKHFAEPTTDPFEVIPILLIHNLILQHFTYKEVKQLFLVCKEWNNIVSRSNVSMKKFQLRIKDLTSPKKFKGLMKSQRKYSSMKIRLESGTDDEPRIRLLQQFSQSLVELEIDIRSHDTITIVTDKIKFPKLKKLALWNKAYKLLPSIETNSLIDFDFDEYDEKNADHVSDFLKKQHRLKRLTVGWFCSDFTNVPFALSFLALSIIYRISPTERHAIHSLLRNMSNSLETVETRNVSPEDIKLVVNELPKLKTFKYRSLEPETDNLILTRNTSVTALEITDYTSISKILILALENLQSLTVDKYNSMEIFKEDFEWIAKNSPKLEYLKCMNDQADIETFRAFYELLKTQDANINQNINISTSMEESSRDDDSMSDRTSDDSSSESESENDSM